MGSIAFLQPWFLFGLAGAAIPLIIHLINRQRRRRIMFSTVRFLVQTDRRSARKYRLVDLLVLLLRMFLLAIIALALSQPIMRPPSAETVAFGRISLAIILDDTLSMRATTEGVSAFDRARDAAATILSQMPQDGEARVILVSGDNPAALTMAASPPSLIADAISDLKPSYSARPMNEAFARALDHLAGSKPRHKSLTIISDNQASTLRDLEAIDHERMKEHVLSMHWIDVGETADNLSVVHVQPSPRVCFPGTPVRLIARIMNASASSQLTNASLWVDGMKVSDAPLQSAPLSAGELVFEHVPQSMGMQKIEVRIEPDALDIDNSRFTEVRVLETVAALLIIPDGQEGDRESVYIHTALNPLASPNYSGKSPVQVRTDTYTTARLSNLATYKVVFVVDNGELPPNILNNLRNYTDQGGTAVVFPGTKWLQGDQESAFSDRRLLADIPVTGLWRQQPGDTTGGIGQFNTSHPVFNLLARAVPQLFNMVTIEAYLQVDERLLNPYAEVAARLTSGEPLLIDSRNNKGRLLVWTTGARPDWTDLPLRPLFLPLLYETLKFASDTDASIQKETFIDDGLTLEMPPPTADIHYTVETPKGERDAALLSAGETTLHYDEKLVPGHYQVYPVENIKQKQIVSVNIHPDETQPGKLPEERLLEIFGEDLYYQAASAAEVAQRLRYASQGYNLTVLLLGLALFIFLVESFLSNLFLRRGESSETESVKPIRRLFHRFRTIGSGN